MFKFLKCNYLRYIKGIMFCVGWSFG